MLTAEGEPRVEGWRLAISVLPPLQLSMLNVGTRERDPEPCV